ncbi:MAG: hypothetical protein AB9836_11295 [Aminipila sp.]
MTKYVGYKIAGDKGAAAAGKMYGVADFTLGCVSGGGALKYFSKVDKVGDLVNVAGKFTSGAGSLIKGTVNVVKNPGLVAKFMKQASVNSVKTLRYSTTTAGSSLVSSANKFATNFATTLGRIGQATKAGASEYAAATARLGITPKSPTVEGVTAAINKYKQLASGTDDVIKNRSNVANTFYHSADPNVINLIKENGFRIDLPTPQQAFHNNRFGSGVYLGNSPATVLAERPGGSILKIEANIGKNLNVVDKGIIEYDMGQAIARGARKHGYDSISFTSKAAQEQGFTGINTMVFDPKRVIVKE